MKIINKRQRILDFLIDSGGIIQFIDYEELGCTSSSDLYYSVKALVTAGCIARLGIGEYRILDTKYTRAIRYDYEKELTRLREIERKYNQICKICQ